MRVKAMINLQFQSQDRANESGAKTQLSQKVARHVSCEKVQVNGSRMWTMWDIGLVIPNALQRETQISQLGQTIKCSHIVRSAEPS